MKRNILTLGAMVAVLGGSLAPAAVAQESERTGTSSFNEITVPVTPRTVALGQTLTGGLDDLSGVEALVSNPAALSTNAGTEVLFSRMEYVADIGVNYIGVGHNFGANNVALSINSWSYGDIPRQTTNEPEIDETETWSGGTTVVAGSFARQFTDRIAAGFSVKGMTQSIDNASANALAVDMGVTYAIPESGFRFGVALRNFGTSARFSGEGLGVDFRPSGPQGEFDAGAQLTASEGELPSSISLSGAYTRQFEGDVSLSALLSARSNAFDPDDYAAGLEFGYADVLFLRGGVNFHTESDASAWQAWNLGAGLNIPAGPTNFRVDYAFRPSSYFSGAHLFSVGVGL